jgi:hypothetical protein
MFVHADEQSRVFQTNADRTRLDAGRGAGVGAVRCHSVTVGAILISLLLRLGAEPFTRWLGLPQTAALIVSTVIIIAPAGEAASLGEPTPIPGEPG